MQKRNYLINFNVIILYNFFLYLLLSLDLSFRDIPKEFFDISNNLLLYPKLNFIYDNYL